MWLLVLLIGMYLLYRFGKWLIKFSVALKKSEESTEDYHRRVLSGIEAITENTSYFDENKTRLDSLREANQELINRQSLRKSIEEELNIKM